MFTTKLTISIIISIHWLLPSVTGHAACHITVHDRRHVEGDKQKRAAHTGIYVHGITWINQHAVFCLLNFCFHFSFRSKFLVVCSCSLSAMLNCPRSRLNENISCIGEYTIHTLWLWVIRRDRKNRWKNLIHICHLRFHTWSQLTMRSRIFVVALS